MSIRTPEPLDIFGWEISRWFQDAHGNITVKAVEVISDDMTLEVGSKDWERYLLRSHVQNVVLGWSWFQGIAEEAPGFTIL